MRQSRGMALLQVLLLTALLMIMLISAQQQAREHLRLATVVKQHSDVNLALNSIEAELLFLLTTREWSDLVNANTPVPGFNFYGKEFEFSGALVKIQDIAGLLSVNSPNTESFAALSKVLFSDEMIGKRIADELADWRDADQTVRQYGAEQSSYADVSVRNYGLQTLDEIRFLKSVTPDVYQTLRPYLTVFRAGENLMNMPAEMLLSRVSPAVAEQMMQSREEGRLNDGLLASMGVDYTDEAFSLRFGRTLQITFTVQNTDVKLTRSFAVTITPSRPVPFEYLEYRMRDTEMEYLNASR